MNKTIETDTQNIVIVLTKKEWNESSNAMKSLCHFAQNEKEKVQENSVNIAQCIDVVFKHIFSKHSATKPDTKQEQQPQQNDNEKEKESKTDICDKVDDLTSNEFDKILDQIANETQQLQENSNNDNNKKKKENELEEQFCENFDGFGDLNYYSVSSLSSLSSIENDYKSMCQDFLSINNQLIDTKLKNLLLENSKSEDDIDYLYDKFIKRRSICALLPFKHCEFPYNKYGLDYIELINKFNENNNKKLKMFCILYNCIVSMFITGDNSDRGGFDKYINAYNSDGNDIDLSSLCQWYILIEMSKCGIFGKGGSDDITSNNKDEVYFGKDVFESSIISSIITNILNNDLTAFGKLADYCVQDIKSNKNIDELKDIYKLNDDSDSGYYGISFYILNRLTYVIFHDLLCININDMNYNMDTSDLLLFPSLTRLFKFFYNFSVYCHCYPHSASYNNKTSQLFYIKEYYQLKNTLFEFEQANTGEKKEKELEENVIMIISISLNRFNYYCNYIYDGSLLHRAVVDNFDGYVELLLKDAFDANMPNKSKWTPISLAKKENRLLILSLLKNSTSQDNDSKENQANKENKENKENKGMNLRSLALRYDVTCFYDMFAFFLSFFVFL